MKNLWNDDIRNTLISTLYITLIGFICTAFYSGITSIRHEITFLEAFQSTFSWLLENRNVTMPLIITLMFLAILSVFLFRRLNKKDPIKWDFNGFLGMGSYQRQGKIEWEITSFQTYGQNVSKKPINNLDGYIQLDRTNEKFPLKLNRDGNVVDIDEIIAIPPDETIQIAVFFGINIANYSSFKGHNPNEFLKRFTPFTFVCIIDGKQYKYKFSTQRVKELIDNHIENFSPKQTGPIYKHN